MSNNEQKAEASTLNCYYFRSSGKSHCRYALAPWVDPFCFTQRAQQQDAPDNEVEFRIAASAGAVDS